jgi:hypothetical protein
MSIWGAPRIHGELFKRGRAIKRRQIHGQATRPPSQGWLTFLRNHAPDIAAMDFVVVPTIAFDLLYAFVIVRIDRRELVWINVTKTPTAEWVARQVTEAFPCDGAPGLHDPRPRSHLWRHRHSSIVPWAFGTSLPHRFHLGRTALPNG